MVENKKILLHIFILLICLPALCSCVDKKAEYRYEDIIVTRYDRGDLSTFVCNKSNDECRIAMHGGQCFYQAVLCIDRDTKKVWIAECDGYTIQHEVDSLNFQGIRLDRLFWKININPSSLGLKMWETLEEHFECYELKGVSHYMKLEEEYSQERFPNSKIEATYYLYSIPRFLPFRLIRYKLKGLRF